MAQRILVLETSHPVVAALRRFLRGAGFEVEAMSPTGAVEDVDPARFVAAAVRPSSPGGVQAFEWLRAADPALPVVVLLDDEDEAGSRLPADGALVAPLSRTVTASLFMALARLRAARVRAASLEQDLADRPPELAGYEFLKKLLLVEVKRSRRYHYPVSLALLAVDGWAGRAAALDEAGRSALLGEVLALVTSAVRDIDLPLVFDGERLLVFMSHTDSLGARTVAQRLVRKVRTHPAGITISAGVSSYDGKGTMSFASLVRGAGEALAEAQAASGDRAAFRVHSDREGGP